MVLGALALAQVAVIPGYLILKLYRVRLGSFIQGAILALALSLVINYEVVFVATLLHAFTRPVIFACIGAEAALAVILVFRANARSGAIPVLRLPRVKSGQLHSLAVLLALGTLVAFAMLGLVVAARLNVFSSWDVVFQWNNWAYRWYAGGLPADSGLYPQLIPTNWAMMYKILGNPEMQSFPLALMPVFPVAVLAMFVDLGLQKKRLEYLLGAALSGALLYLLRPEVALASGLIEPPLMFMVLATLYVMELQEGVPASDWRRLALPMALAAGASVTKFNGFIALIAVLAVAVKGHSANRAALTTRDMARSTALVVAILLVVPGAWYTLKGLDFLQGRDAPNTAELSRVTQLATGGNGYLSRAVGAVSKIPGGWLTVALCAGLVILTARLPRAKWVSAGLVLYTILWAQYLSYDFRNEFIVVPFIAYLCALGMSALLQRAGISADLDIAWGDGVHLGPRAAVVTAVSCGVLLAAANLALPWPTLLAHEIALQRDVGVREVNTALYDAQSRLGGLRGRMLTDYAYVRILPDFRNDPVRMFAGKGLNIDYVEPQILDIESLHQHDYLLLSDSPEHARVNDAVRAGLSDGSYSIVFETSGGRPGQAFAEPVTVRLLKAN